MQKFKNFQNLLAFAYPPTDVATISEWRPFPLGDTLDLIIMQHNEWRINEQRKKFIPDFFNLLSEGVKVFPLSLNNREKLSEEILGKMHILVFDCSAFKDDSERLESLRISLIGASYKKAKSMDKYFKATQLSESIDVVSLCSNFRGLPFIWSDPEILNTQKQFEQYLKRLGELYIFIGGQFSSPVAAVDMVSATRMQSIIKESDVTKTVLDNIPNLVSEMRDEALFNNLDNDQIMSNLREKVAQEYLVAKIAYDAEKVTSQYIDTFKLRNSISPLLSESIIKLDLEPVDFVGLSLNSPLSALSHHQRAIVRELDLSGKNSVVVQLDQPALWENVNQLGNKIESIRFTTELPGGTSITSQLS